MEQERDFKGVWISKEIWLDERLTAIEKIILVEIDSLDCGEKGCYASNEHLANFCQCSITKVSGAISKLIKLNYIYVESFNGRQRVLKSRLTKNVRQDNKNCNAELQNLKESNIIDNNIINNNKKEKKETEFDEILNEVDNEKLKETLIAFIKMRKTIKKPMTTHAFELLIKKLNKMSSDIDIRIQVLERSILNGWQDIYEIKPEIKKEEFTRNNYTKEQISALITDLDNVEV
jgi:hypothetical protein